MHGRWIKDTPEGDAIIAAAEFIGITPERMKATLAIYLINAPAFQDKVAPWMQACFGPEISADKTERNQRFIEEALELIQACGATRDDCHRLVDYVYDRPVGERGQEVGGVMVTLAALCLAQSLDMHKQAEIELARINAPEIIIKIREKQKRKPKGSPLPQEGS